MSQTGISGKGKDGIGAVLILERGRIVVVLRGSPSSSTCSQGSVRNMVHQSCQSCFLTFRVDRDTRAGSTEDGDGPIIGLVVQRSPQRNIGTSYLEVIVCIATVLA